MAHPSLASPSSLEDTQTSKSTTFEFGFIDEEGTIYIAIIGRMNDYSYLSHDEFLTYDAAYSELGALRDRLRRQVWEANVQCLEGLSPWDVVWNKALEKTLRKIEALIDELNDLYNHLRMNLDT